MKQGWLAVWDGIIFLISRWRESWKWVLLPFFVSFFVMAVCGVISYKIIIYVILPSFLISGPLGYVFWFLLLWVGFTFSVIFGIVFTEGFFYATGLTTGMIARQRECWAPGIPFPEPVSFWTGFYLEARLFLLFVFLLPFQIFLLLLKPVSFLFPFLLIPFTIMSFLVHGWFLGLWYMSYIFAFERIGFRAGLIWLWNHFFSFTFMGLILNLLFFNPIVYYLLFPVGITSANRLFQSCSTPRLSIKLLPPS